MDIVEEIKDLVEEGKEAVEKVIEKAEGKKPKKKASKKDKKESEEEPSEKNIEKLAELESTEKEKSLEEKKKALLEKAAKLKGKVSVDMPTSEELKEKVRGKKKTDMLIPLDDYVKSGIYLGTRVVTPNMRPFVYRRRADGLAIFNTDIIDEKIKEGIEFLSKFNPKDVVVICKRQAGWRVVEKFSELTGIRAFTKKYPAGILTNTDLPNFFENELTIITDHWLDKNALNDTLNVNKKVLMICDTNNFSKGSDQIIIGNNKSAKSLGVIFYLLTRGYCKAKKIDVDIPDLDWWVEEE